MKSATNVVPGVSEAPTNSKPEACPIDGTVAPLEPPATVTGQSISHWIETNYHPYTGDSSFLEGPTDRTLALNALVQVLLKKERENGVLDVDAATPSGIDAFAPGYIQRESEVVVGLQTDAPLKRSIKPLGGFRIVEKALESFGYKPEGRLEEIFTKYRKTHNDGVFSAYTPEMRAARKSHILTGLPDGYGRGRIIGDYRRVALYGVDRLIQAKVQDRETILDPVDLDEKTIQLREEVAEQISALKELKSMAKGYGFDLSKAASTAKEAVQWLYFAYLAAIKEQDGAAMSFGRVDAFLDIFFEHDLATGVLTESQAQELIDQLVLKLRLVRHLRTPEYNALFAGDPTWVTCVLGGLSPSGESMVTKTSFRFLRTLYNLGAAPEPNITIAWSQKLDTSFKSYCAQVSVETSSIQYESDELMRPRFGSDYSIACCVSAMKTGQDMQFFGARANLPKLLLYSLNAGRDEISGAQVGPQFPEPKLVNGALDYESVLDGFDKALDWLSELYVKTMNIIHFMHDKYAYERIEMALHDTEVRRLMAFGMAGLSVLTDSLSAIKHAKVCPTRDDRGLTNGFLIDGNFPKYGNDNPEADKIAQWIVTTFHKKLSQHYSYRNSIATLSILTITSNLVYGKYTGSTPDGRDKGTPFAPGANPMHGRDESGALASLNSVASVPYDACLDGISNTFSLVPSTLGKELKVRVENLSGLLDGYFLQGGHHINVNVLDREKLMDAVDHPEKYPNLTIRVSGYAVHFNRLTREQQLEVIARTFHETM
eukprot:g5734.t1